jgi:glycerol-3-phosphate O-acyltransferase
LLPFVEAYTIVLDQFVRLKVGEALESKACVEQGLAEGRQAYLLRRISSEASIGKILFENGYKMVEHLGLAGVTTEEVARSRRKLLAEFRGLSRRMEKMRIELLAQAERNAEREMGT